MSADPMRLPHNRIVVTSDPSLVNTTTTVRSNVSVIDGVAHRTIRLTGLRPGSARR
jgi:hypothetical protein